jgi:hypothetical protein
MKNKVRYIAVVSTVAMVAVVAASLMISARSATERNIEFIPIDSADFWPLDHAWSWRLKPQLFTKSDAEIIVRTTETELPPGTSLSIPLAPAHPSQNGTEIRSGRFTSLDNITRNQEGRATCQVIDLRAIGTSQAEDSPLRLVVRFRIGGSSNSLSGEQLKLPGDQFAGSTTGRCEWQDDELHIQTFYTRSAQTVYSHHLLLRQSNRGNVDVP